ncbi:MAG: helix-turn-helix domain-containing protein, partial [Pseudomonadota bacterium]
MQIIRDWVIRFNAEDPGGLIDRKGSGPPSRLNDAQRTMLRQAVEDGPKPYWTVSSSSVWLFRYSGS